MQRIGSYFIAQPDGPTTVQQFKIIFFGLTMWITAFVVLFLLVPLVFGAVATKPKLFRIFAMMSMPMIFGSGLVGLNSKSKSLKELLLRAFLAAFGASWCFSMTLLVD